MPKPSSVSSSAAVLGACALTAVGETNATPTHPAAIAAHSAFALHRTSDPPFRTGQSRGWAQPAESVRDKLATMERGFARFELESELGFSPGRSGYEPPWTTPTK